MLLYKYYYHLTPRSLQCGVVAVVCEEASQVAERDLLVALPRSTLHLILIGI